MGQQEVEILPVESSTTSPTTHVVSTGPKQLNDLLQVKGLSISTEIHPILTLESKLKEVLNEEVPNTPPPHDWYNFVFGAVGMVSAIVSPPFPDYPFGNIWQVCMAAFLTWSFSTSLAAHRRNKDSRRNKATIINSVMKKLKGDFKY